MIYLGTITAVSSQTPATLEVPFGHPWWFLANPSTNTGNGCVSRRAAGSFRRTIRAPTARSGGTTAKIPLPFARPNGPPSVYCIVIEYL